jgi:hypothetical protein
MTFVVNNKGEWPCPNCDKVFNKQLGVRMHFFRKHEKRIKTPRKAALLKLARQKVKANGVARAPKVRKTVSVCPVCGTNIHAVEIAINL